jgi:hypothetical protein
MTSIVAHLIASILAIRSLRSHKIGRWYSIVVLLAGIITPIIPSALTSKYFFLRIRMNWIVF